MSFQKYAVIPAGGKGTRMIGDMPKQFIEIGGKPVLMHTLEAFYNYSTNISIILVLAEHDIPYWRELCYQYDFKIPHLQQTGGASRYESVGNGLNCIESSHGVVAIHDGVRPLVTPHLIGKAFEFASENGTAIPAVHLKDSIRKVVNNHSFAVDRNEYRIVQTPQTFQVNLIIPAYKLPQSQFQTDDAGVAEQAGHTINIIEGDYSNIKITSSEDLWVAESLMVNGNQSR